MVHFRPPVSWPPLHAFAWRLHWQRDAEGPALVVELDERTAITGKAIRGRVIVRPAAIFAPRVELDQAGRHRWYPIAPQARVEVELDTFYSRNLIGVTLRGREGRAVHESVDLRRFASGWVRFLLPFRIRRQT